jgi:hypothetical protein
MSNKPGRRYLAVGSSWVRRDFWHWGPLPEGYDVYIQVRDLYSERDARVYEDGHHKVVVTGPSPKPRSKSFKGEMAWADADRYAGDVVSELQRQVRAA